MEGMGATVPEMNNQAVVQGVKRKRRGEDWTDQDRSDLPNTGNPDKVIPVNVLEQVALLFHACHRAGLVVKRPSDKYKLMVTIEHGVIKAYQVRRPAKPVPLPVTATVATAPTPSQGKAATTSPVASRPSTLGLGIILTGHDC